MLSSTVTSMGSIFESQLCKNRYPILQNCNKIRRQKCCWAYLKATLCFEERLIYYAALFSGTTSVTSHQGTWVQSSGVSTTLLQYHHLISMRQQISTGECHIFTCDERPKYTQQGNVEPPPLGCSQNCWLFSLLFIRGEFLVSLICTNTPSYNIKRHFSENGSNNNRMKMTWNLRCNRMETTSCNICDRQGELGPHRWNKQRIQKWFFSFFFCWVKSRCQGLDRMRGDTLRWSGSIKEIEVAVSKR